MRYLTIFIITSLVLTSFSCENRDPDDEKQERVYYSHDNFVMGADLSYVNQILDFGGEYRDSGIVEDPYLIFSQYGTNVVRLRLFHNPVWTKEVYGNEGTRMYNDFDDVARAIELSKNRGMAVCLDFHYSDSWADPSKQVPPAAWEGLSLEVLGDSLYNYTYNTLNRLSQAGLMPEYVQVGNEINPGLLLPQGARWGGNPAGMVTLLNRAINAVRDAAHGSTINPKIIVHVAQPENALPWFDGLADAGLADFDIVGLSYYYIWSDTPLSLVSERITEIKAAIQKPVMVVETAFPFTTANADSYGNILGLQRLPASGHEASVQGQYDYLVELTQEIIDGGGSGIIYWEPAWITSDIKDLWGTGSAWDCNTLFNFGGAVIRGMNYMTVQYDF